MKGKKNQGKRSVISFVLALTVALMFALPAAVFANETVVDPNETGSITIHKYLLDGTYPTLRNDGTTMTAIGIPSDAQQLGAVDGVTSIGGGYTGVKFDVTKVVPLDAADTTTTVVFTSDGVRYGKDTSWNGGNVLTQTTAASNGETTFINLPVGVYLIHEQKPPMVVRPADDFLVSVPTTIQGSTDNTNTPDIDESKDYLLYDVHVYPKNEDIGISKKVGTGVDTASGTPGLQENKTDSRGADYDEPVNWYITADLPPQIADNASNYTIYDTYAAGLAYVPGSVEITVGDETTHSHTDYTYPATKPTLTEGTDYYVYFYNNTTLNSDGLATGGGYLKIVFTDTGRAKLGFNAVNDYYEATAPDGTLVDITYYKTLEVKLTTQVLPSAALNTALENSSSLKFVNDPSYEETTTGHGPETYPDNPPYDPDYPNLPRYPEDPTDPTTPYDPTDPSNSTNPLVDPDGNNPSYPSTPENPSVPTPVERVSEEPFVYTGALRIVKEDAKDHSITLTGAAFKLVPVDADYAAAAANWDGGTVGSGKLKFSYTQYQADLAASTAQNQAVLDASVSSGFVQRSNGSGGYVDYEVTTGTDGIATFAGLSYGIQNATSAQNEVGATTAYYYLVEVNAPKGYNLPDVNTTPIVAVNYTSFDSDPTNVTYDPVSPTEIYNSKSFLLPFTGGKGSILFVVAGIILIGAGLALIVGRRKKVAE